MDDAALDRRGFLARASGLAMAGGLATSYGTAGLIAARYLFPAKTDALEWVFVATLERLAPGESLLFRSPAGDRVTLARRTAGGSAEDFIALSSTCPHLGCQVHWEAHRNRFFCPCHNGVFEPSGQAIAGPPAEAGQSLPRYELKVEQGLIYIRVPTARLTGGNGERVAAAGIEAPAGACPGDAPEPDGPTPRAA